MTGHRRFRKPARPYHTNIARYKEKRWLMSTGEEILVPRKQEFRVPAERGLTKEELVELLTAARWNDTKAKQKLQRFYIKEVELQLLLGKQKFEEYYPGSGGSIQEQKARFMWADPEFLTDLAFRPALEEWLSKNKKFNPKRFSAELKPLVAKHIEEWRKLLQPKMGDLSHFEIVEEMLFPQFTYLKRRSESMGEFRQLFRIALHDYIINTWMDRLAYRGNVMSTSRANWEDRMRTTMDRWKDGHSKTLSAAKSLEKPLPRRTAEFEKDNLASRSDRLSRNLRIRFPMPHNERERSRQQQFVAMLWNQLKPSEKSPHRNNMFEEWEGGRNPAMLTIWTEEGEKAFQNPKIQDLRVIYEQWVQTPGPITLRWREWW